MRVIRARPFAAAPEFEVPTARLGVAGAGLTRLAAPVEAATFAVLGSALPAADLLARGDAFVTVAGRRAGFGAVDPFVAGAALDDPGTARFEDRPSGPAPSADAPADMLAPLVGLFTQPRLSSASVLTHCFDKT